MTEPTGPSTPQQPQDPQAAQKAQGATPPRPLMNFGSDGGASSGFAKMLGPTATPEQVQKAMMQAINFIIQDLKREAAKAHETAKHMKDVIEGKDD